MKYINRVEDVSVMNLEITIFFTGCQIINQSINHVNIKSLYLLEVWKLTIFR